MEISLFQRVKKNLLLLMIAILATGALFYVTKNPDFFAASVLNLQEQQFIQEKNRDLAYKNTSGVLDIFVAPKYTDIQKVKIEVIYNTEKTSLSTTANEVQGTYSVVQYTGSLLIETIHDTPLQAEKSLIVLGLSGEEKVVISEAKILIQNERKEDLAIGNLSEYNDLVHKQ